MNISKFQIPFRSIHFYDSNKKGQLQVTTKRPEGMSGRQWKKHYKAARKGAAKITISK